MLETNRHGGRIKRKSLNPWAHVAQPFAILRTTSQSRKMPCPGPYSVFHRNSHSHKSQAMSFSCTGHHAIGATKNPEQRGELRRMELCYPISMGDHPKRLEPVQIKPFSDRYLETLAVAQPKIMSPENKVTRTRQIQPQCPPKTFWWMMPICFGSADLVRRLQDPFWSSPRF